MRNKLAFALVFLTLCCVIARFVGAEGPTKVSSPDAGRLDVSASLGCDSGSLISQKDGPDGKKLLHGMQVRIGPNNVLQEYSVFNEGLFEQRTQFFPGGKIFRMQRREHNGDESDVIYTADSNKIVAPSVKV